MLLGTPLPNLRGALGAKPGQQMKRLGEPAMLNDFSKEPLDFIDLDDVQVMIRCCLFFIVDFADMARCVSVCIFAVNIS